MKALFAAVTGALLIASCPWAMAASTTDLTVRGTITPSACMPSISSGGVVDYGKIAAHDLEYGTVTYLPPFTLDFAVDCDAQTLFALIAQDNRPRNNTGQAFGFARINNQPLGAYYVDVSNFLADGVSVIRMYSRTNGQSWTPQDTYLPWEPKVLTAFGDLSSGVAAPIPTQNLSMSMLISGLIYQSSWLPLEQEIPIDGSATIEVRYL